MSMSRRHYGAVAGLIGLHIALATFSAMQKSPTYDEPAHLTAGYSYWMFNDYRLQPENGNLPQRWFALPLLWGNTQFPDDADAWRTSDVWSLGNDFLYHTGNRAESLLFRGRLFATLLSAGLCFVVFFWAKELFGLRGGFVSLLLCALSPTILAHGRLMTSDICATLFFTLATWSIWKCLHRVTVGSTLRCAASVSCLAISKGTIVLIVPVAALMVIARFGGRRPLVVRGPRGREITFTGRLRPLAIVGTVAAACALSAFGTVWLAYGFRFDAANGSEAHEFYKIGSLERVTEDIEGTPGRLLRWFAERRLLPEPYLYGIAYVAAHRNRSAFLNGDYSDNGWWYFFPDCFAVKTPLPLFGVLLLAVAAIFFTKNSGSARTPATVRQMRYDTIPLWCLLAGLWPVFILSSLNIGHRHLLPTYPAMFVLAGASARWFCSPSRFARLLPCLLLVGFVGESARAYPHYLAYFNELVGRKHAYRHLVDSSLDWGQDLPGLSNWLADHDASNRSDVYLAYFGQGDPSHYGIDAISIPVENWRRPFLKNLHGGLFCVSATHLMNVYGDAGGRWTAAYERTFRNALAMRDDPSKLPNSGITGQSPSETRQQLEGLCDVLAAARLMAYLQQREPDDHIGYSILIFHLTDEEVHDALHGPLSAQ